MLHLSTLFIPEGWIFPPRLRGLSPCFHRWSSQVRWNPAMCPVVDRLPLDILVKLFVIVQHTMTSWWLNHPFEKYEPQFGSIPQVGLKIKNVWNHHTDDVTAPLFFGSGRHRTSVTFPSPRLKLDDLADLPRPRNQQAKEAKNTTENHSKKQKLEHFLKEKLKLPLFESREVNKNSH